MTAVRGLRPENLAPRKNFGMSPLMAGAGGGFSASSLSDQEGLRFTYGSSQDGSSNMGLMGLQSFSSSGSGFSDVDGLPANFRNGLSIGQNQKNRYTLNNK